MNRHRIYGAPYAPPRYRDNDECPQCGTSDTLYDWTDDGRYCNECGHSWPTETGDPEAKGDQRRDDKLTGDA